MDVASRERWPRVETLFAAAVELGAEGREAYLEQTCSGDRELRRELERLLAAHDAADGFLVALDTAAAGALLGAAPDEDPQPARIGAYEIVRRLGSGGMGIVYLAHDPRLDRPVALKILRSRDGAQTLPSRHLINEARAASALDHPHIAPVYEIGETADGPVFIAMAYCEGESLTELIARQPLAPELAAELARQVADALGAAHQRGIVHRDVKPANIIISEHRRARLVDFGIAKVAGRERGTGGAIPGTLAYMSPEQSLGEDTDGRTDVWALGVVLYEMLTGLRPFRGDTTTALLHAIQRETPKPLSDLRPDTPPALAKIIERCLAKDAGDRPADGAVVAAELSEFLSSAARRDARRWRSPSRATSMVAAIIVIAVVGVSLLQRAARNRPRDFASLIVIPFAPVVPDTALERLGRELVVTLSSNLDGAGGLRVIDPITVLGGDDARGIRRGELDGAVELARRLGANRIVHGRLVRASSGVRLEAAVYAADDRRALARASAEAPLDAITVLTDSITLGLLRTEWAGRGAVPNPAAITTSSVPALHAYLQGELAIANAQFRTASQSFARAMAADSTFWFAYWRYMYARGYHSEPVDSAIVAAVIAHRSDFPEQDRLLVESRLTPGQQAKLALRREITKRYPTYWPAWFELGDQLTHGGAFLGVSSEEARAVLTRTVDLNPRFLPAWEHLFWLAVLAHDTLASGRALANMTTLQIDSLSQGEWNLERLDYHRYLDRLARTNGAPREAESEIGARVIARGAEPRNLERLATSLTVYGFHRAQLDLSRRLRAHSARPEVLVAHRWGAALAWAGRGAWDSAFVAARDYARTTTNSRGALWAFGLATTGAWLGSLPADSATTLRPVAERSESARTAAGVAELDWLDGLLACVRGDRTALAASRAAIASNAAQDASTLDRSLAAFAAAMAGGPYDAGRSLARLEWANADAGWAFKNGDTHPFVIAINRLAAGRWLLAGGDTAEATKLLLVQESDLPAELHPLPAVDLIVGTMALPILSRIESARGRPDQARRYDDVFRGRADLTAKAPKRGNEPSVCGG